MISADRSATSTGRLDRAVSLAANRAVTALAATPRVGRWVHQLFARLLPVRRFTVRGVAVRCVVPLHQVGTYNEAERWGAREPEVLDWIDGFGPDDVFFDIGANFGTETLYAALKPGGPRRIYAFDCEMIGSYNLAANLLLNDVRHVQNVVCALGAESGLVRLSENLNYLHVLPGAKYGAAEKSVPCYAVDDLVALLGVAPTRVKIDVDGPEAAIVAGMGRTLASGQVRSLMIEINGPAAQAAIAAALAAAGFVERPVGGGINHLFERA